MRNKIFFLVVVLFVFGCKDDAVKKPDNLIDKEVMQNIIYDLSLLEAIKYNDPSTAENYKVNPKEFIFKKYKVDSAQFAQNNAYYASDYDEYKAMYDTVVKRIESKKSVLDTLIKKEAKRDSLIAVKRKQDSIKGVKKIALAKKKDSLQKIKKKDSLLLLKKKAKAPKKTSTTVKPTAVKNGAKVN